MAQQLQEFIPYIRWMQNSASGRRPLDQSIQSAGATGRPGSYSIYPPSPFNYYSARKTILILQQIQFVAWTLNCDRWRNKKWKIRGRREVNKYQHGKHKRLKWHAENSNDVTNRMGIPHQPIMSKLSYWGPRTTPAKNDLRAYLGRRKRLWKHFIPDIRPWTDVK